jgi:hypothetical protein
LSVGQKENCTNIKKKGVIIMVYKRREGLAGGGITRFMDTNVSVCPCCGSKHRTG